MSAEDTNEIINLLNLYALAVDTLQWDLFDRIFLPDVKLEFPGGGWDDLASYKIDFHDMHAPLYTSQHMVTNHQVVVTGDRANALSYARARLFQTGPEAGSIFFEFGGWYDDVLVRTPSGWRISFRACRGNWLLDHAGMAKELVKQNMTTLRRAAGAGAIAYLQALERQ